MESHNTKELTLVNRLNNNEKERMICSSNDNFVIIKKKLSQLIDVDEQNIQFYNQKSPILNINNFVSFDTDVIFYEVFDIPVNYVIIEIRNNYFGIPKWIAINSNATVANLKEEISNFAQNDLQTFLFHEKEMLENNRTIESYKIGNGSKIKVWRGPNLLVKLKFYFHLNNSGNIPKISTLQFSMTDSINAVKNRISEKISPGIALNLALITDSSYWQNDKRLIDYPIRQEETEVTVVDLQIEVFLEIRNNYFGIPKWIAINSNATVAKLKEEISNFTQNGLQTFLFHEMVMLGDNRTIESYNIGDRSKIKVWRGPNLLVKLKFYFHLNNSVNIPKISTLQFSMTNSINDVKNRISEKISPGIALNLALITDSSYWQNDKRLIDYPIRQEETEVTVVDLQMTKLITLKDQIKRGTYAKIFDANDNFGSRIIVNRYKTNKEIINKRKVLKYEIIAHTLLDRLNINKFVELITMYEKDEYFYIATEYMDRGSLKTLYLESSLSENDIIKYSIQIGEALDYMHSNKFMHRNITCSSVLVNSKNEVKLTNFHLSKYLFDATIEQLLEGIPGSNIETSKCWMAPEVLRNDPYGIKADIWSLGVTILEMFTHDRPYPNMNVLRATHKIVTENRIHYDRNRIPQRLHDIIDRCLHLSQWERPSAKQCCQLLREI